jgi:hypothetical protein
MAVFTAAIDRLGGLAIQHGKLIDIREPVAEGLDEFGADDLFFTMGRGSADRQPREGATEEIPTRPRAEFCTGRR